MASKYSENTLRRQERELERLQKDNFNLQLRVAAFEQKFGPVDASDARSAALLQHKEEELDQCKLLLASKAEELDIAMDALAVLNAASAESSLVDREVSDNSAASDHELVRDLKARCDELSRDKRFADIHLEELTNKIDALHAENDAKNVDKLTSVGWRSVDEMEQGPELINFLQEQVKTLEEQMDLATNKFAASDAQNEQAMQEVDNLEQQIRSHEQQITAARKAHQQQVDAITQSNAQLTNQLDQLRGDHQATIDRAEIAEQQLAQVEETHQTTLAQQKQQYEEEIQLTATKTQKLEEELGRQTTELQKSALAQDRLETLEKDTVSFAEQLCEMEKEVATAKQGMSETIKERDALQTSLDAVNCELHEARTTAAATTEQLNEANARHDQLQEDLGESRTDLKRAQELIANIEEERDLSNEVRDDMQNDLDEAEKNIAFVTNEMAKAQEENKELEQRLEEITGQISPLTRDVTRMTSEIAAHSHEQDLLEDTLESTTRELALAKKTVEELTSENMAANREREIAENTSQGLARDLEKAEGVISELRQSQACAKNERDDAVATVVESLEDQQRLYQEKAQSDIQALQAKVKAHSDSLSNVMAQYSTEIASLREDLEQSHEECETLKDAIDHRDDVASELASENKRLKTQIEKNEILAAQIDELEKELSRKENDSQANFLEKEEELQRERDAAIESKAEIIRLQEDAKESQKQLEVGKEGLATLQEEVARLRTEARRAQEELKVPLDRPSLNRTHNVDGLPTKKLSVEEYKEPFVAPILRHHSDWASSARHKSRNFEENPLEEGEILECLPVAPDANLDKGFGVGSDDNATVVPDGSSGGRSSDSRRKSSSCSTDSGPLSPCIDGNDNRLVLSSRSPSERGAFELVQGEKFALGPRPIRLSITGSPANRALSRVAELEAQVVELKLQLQEREPSSPQVLQERHPNVYVPESPSSEHSMKSSLARATGPLEKLVLRQIEATKRSLFVSQKTLDAEMRQYISRLGSKSPAVQRVQPIFDLNAHL